MGKTKRPAKDRRPVKVAVDVDETVEETVETVEETQGTTVAENENSEVEEAVSNNSPVEEEKAPKTEKVKVYTEEQLAIMSRENLKKALADIKSWKAVCEQRH